MHEMEPIKEMCMYPHVVQFETRWRELECELQLIRERGTRASSRRSRARTGAGLAATRASRKPELEPELTIERT